jgi:2-hydroxy-3-keto-5-methylthiopentenyl-1-phosphate phosphatase
VNVVVDWDGTVTEVDGLHMLIEEFGDRRVFTRTERALREGRAMLHEVIAEEMATISFPLARIADWVRAHVTVRPGFREFAERYRPVVLSSGFVELIEPVLEREGVELEVHANRLTEGPRGWTPVWRDDAQCETCGEPCKRGGLPAARPVVYVGDGYSDHCVALAADRVFARNGLARYLAEQGVAYEPFDDFAALQRRLTG